MRVLFVSKPVVPPWNDGSKNLVRDVATHLVRTRPTIMVAPGASPLGGAVVEETVYGEIGAFSPTLSANARVMARLLFGDPLDAWHFVFAPNTASSAAGWMAKRSRRASGWQGLVVQTIASAPRSFRGVRRLLFGDVVVAQSEHTRGRMLGEGVPARDIRVIPPCAEAPRERSEADKRAARDALGIDAKAPLVVYPGDLEVSTGAATVAAAAKRIVHEIPEARVVLACRRKTAGALAAEDALRASCAELEGRVHFAGDVDDMHGLLAAADVVAMPVDDLYGKVDIPLVVIEALALGKPLVLARGGPLESVDNARFVDPGDDAAVAEECLRALRGEVASEAERGKRLYAARFSPAVVAEAYEQIYDAR